MENNLQTSLKLIGNSHVSQYGQCIVNIHDDDANNDKHVAMGGAGEAAAPQTHVVSLQTCAIRTRDPAPYQQVHSRNVV